MWFANRSEATLGCLGLNGNSGSLCELRVLVAMELRVEGVEDHLAARRDGLRGDSPARGSQNAIHLASTSAPRATGGDAPPALVLVGIAHVAAPISTGNTTGVFTACAARKGLKRVLAVERAKALD